MHLNIAMTVVSIGGGLYEHFDRVSCWCCPLKRIGELRQLYTYYPDLWKQLKDMDNRAYNNFKKNYTVELLERKFKREEVNNASDRI
jgi:hypothetical protein